MKKHLVKKSKSNSDGPVDIVAAFCEIGAYEVPDAEEFTSFTDFIAGVEPKHTYLGRPVIFEKNSDSLLVIDRNIVWDIGNVWQNHKGCSTHWIETFKGSYKLKFQEESPVGVLVPMTKTLCKKKGLLSYKYFVICNADVDTFNNEPDGDVCRINLFEGINGEGKNDTPGVSVSFRCLGRFTKYSTPLGAANDISNKTLQIVAFEADQTINVSPSLAKQISSSARKKNPDNDYGYGIRVAIRSLSSFIKPPQKGFTLIEAASASKCYWHRASTSLFRINKSKNTILIGFDEGSYFGAEVKGMFNKISDVYAALMPEAAKNLPNPIRQGEWFFIPVKEKNLPENNECIAIYRNQNIPEVFGEDSDDDDGKNYEGLALPIDDETSSRHIVSSKSNQEILIGKDGNIYVYDPLMQHSRGQHDSIDAKGWYTFAKNTAIRSFSVQGVD